MQSLAILTDFSLHHFRYPVVEYFITLAILEQPLAFLPRSQAAFSTLV